MYMRSLSPFTFSPFRNLVAAAFLTTFLSCSIPAQSQEPSPGSISLMPSEAKIVGTAKLNRGQDNIDVIGFWKDPKDRIEWTASFPSPGTYDVFLDYSQKGVRPGAVGSLMELAVGDQKLQVRLQDTEDWENPCYQYCGQVQIRQAGGVPVNLSVIEKRGTDIMSVRLIRLIPSRATSH